MQVHIYKTKPYKKDNKYLHTKLYKLLSNLSMHHNLAEFVVVEVFDGRIEVRWSIRQKSYSDLKKLQIWMT